MTACDKNITIYSLSDPDTMEIRYIGKTIQDPKYRYASHISTARHNRKKDYCHCWIKSILNKDKVPILTIIEETNDIKRESYWIFYYRDLGNNIVNLSDGGELGPIGARWKISKEKLKTIPCKRKRQISQYDLNGNFIRDWDTTVSFCRYYKLSNTVASSSLYNHNTCNGFILIDKNKEFIKPKRILNNPIIIKNILTAEIKEYYNSIEASSQIGCDNSTLSKSIKNNTILLKKYKIKLKY